MTLEDREAVQRDERRTKALEKIAQHLEQIKFSLASIAKKP